MYARAVSALIALVVVGWPQGFPDVPPGHWAAHGVTELKRLGILKGYPGGRFADGNAEGPLPAAKPREVAQASPNGALSVAVRFEPGSARPAFWSASYKGKPLLANCAISLTDQEAGDLFASARIVSVTKGKRQSRVPVLFGKASVAEDSFNEARFHLRTPNGTDLMLFFRVYDDAVAYRTEIRSLPKGRSPVIESEDATFGVLGNPTAYAQVLENFTTSHEHTHTVLPLKQIMPGRLLDTPLTLRRNDGICLSITEAALTRYAGMSLMRPVGDQSGELVARLSPRPDGAKVIGPLPLKTPWRVVLVSEGPGGLLESNTLYCLNPPNAIGDTSWIKPGKMTWTWWNNYLFDHERGAPIFNTEVQKRHIDWCAANGVLYHDVVADERDQPWYVNGQDGLFPGPGADVGKVRPELDLSAVRAYADSKGVRLWTWVHQGALRGRDLDNIFGTFAALGWAGMMVDFFDRDDQDTVEFAERILQAAARRRILIHFHGICKPTGWQRTYPNLMNHEGSLNLEYLKWGAQCTPHHTLTVAFNRLVAGPMDYHLGGFRSSTREAFRPQNVAPLVLGTRAFNLALYLLIDNPNPMLADYPMAYEGQTGFDFLKEVPTYWDETRVLKAEIGILLIVARRKGDTWWIGGASAGPRRNLGVPLGMLRSGRYTLKLWSDKPESDVNPNQIAVTTRVIQSAEKINIAFAKDGGFVAKLEPVR